MAKLIQCVLIDEITALNAFTLVTIFTIFIDIFFWNFLNSVMIPIIFGLFSCNSVELERDKSFWKYIFVKEGKSKVILYFLFASVGKENYEWFQSFPL